MYQINEFIFQINNPDAIPMPSNLQKFKASATNSHYTYDLMVVDAITIKEKEFALNKNNIKILQHDHLEKRYLLIQNDTTPYAMCEEINDNYTKIQVHKDYVGFMYIDTMFISLLSLERRMHYYDQYILHSSYIVHNNQAILFTAPSGVGKSTQAHLWQQYRNCKTINGDRTLLKKENGTYFACGWPICGSSEICENEKYPIACIVVLSQSKENTITKLAYKDKFKRLLSEMTINYHNVGFVNKAMDFIDDVSNNIKIYHLSCDISEDAVICLENQMKEDFLWML